MADINEIVKGFVEGRLGAEEFFGELYGNGESEAELSAAAEVGLGNVDSLYMFLLEGDPSDSGFVRDAKRLLGEWLGGCGVTFKPDRTYEILEKAVPDWLDLGEEDFREILRDGKLTAAQKTAAVKDKIKSEYRFLRRPPNWLQSPEWAFANGKPLLFVGELAHGDAMLYIFYNAETDEYTTVRQYT